jgi:hypothetical protein
MKRVGAIIMVLSLVAACSRLPALITEPIQDAGPPNQICRSAFPEGDWQLQHVIEATVRGRKMGRLIGAVVLSGQSRTIECALMTIEGLVLFSARFDGTLIVDRAVKPFDRPGFAQGLIDDLMLMFMHPKGLRQVGRSAEGRLICRHWYPEDNVTDVIIDGPNSWLINQYSSQGKLLRTVTAGRQNNSHADDRSGIAQHMTMETRSGSGYRLELRLIDAVPLQTPEDSRSSLNAGGFAAAHTTRSSCPADL